MTFCKSFGFSNTNLVIPDGVLCICTSAFFNSVQAALLISETNSFFEVSDSLFVSCYDPTEGGGVDCKSQLSNFSRLCFYSCCTDYHCQALYAYRMSTNEADFTPCVLKESLFASTEGFKDQLGNVDQSLKRYHVYSLYGKYLKIELCNSTHNELFQSPGGAYQVTSTVLSKHLIVRNNTSPDECIYYPASGVEYDIESNVIQDSIFCHNLAVHLFYSYEKSELNAISCVFYGNDIQYIVEYAQINDCYVESGVFFGSSATAANINYIENTNIIVEKNIPSLKKCITMPFSKHTRTGPSIVWKHICQFLIISGQKY